VRGTSFLFMLTGGSVWGMVLPRNATGLLLVVSGCEVFKRQSWGRFSWQVSDSRKSLAEGDSASLRGLSFFPASACPLGRPRGATATGGCHGDGS
jgi:hypothetical protein